jgi:hypothetical protein
MLGLAVQPPAHTKPGVAIYPPIAARLSDETNIYEELSQVWAVASLIGYSGEVLEQKLGGKVVDSAHPIAENANGSGQGTVRDRAYFYFPDLVIYEPGRYRIRITLMRMNYSYELSPEGDARVDEYVDSQSITVQDGMAANHSRPSE